jgi:type I restriction enzyme S subunit
VADAAGLEFAMSVDAYAEYKESGVEWLGRVPQHWTTSKIKYAYRFSTGWTPPTGDSANYDGDNIWVNISDLGPRVISDAAKRLSDAAIEKTDIALSPAGSLLFSFKLSIGQVSFAGCDLYTNEAIASFPPQDGVNLEFAFYAFPLFIVKNASENIYGAKMLNQELIRSALICLPPLPEQSDIATFLDRETGKIDALVEEQRRLIALLKEKRQAVISHAVTKGLNPNTPMKDSGIEWLGEVPAHWTVAKAKHFLSVASGFAFPSERFSQDANDVRLLRGINIGVGKVRWDEAVYWNRQSDDGLDAFALVTDQLVIGMDRPWISEGLRIAMLSEDDVPALLLQRVAALNPASGVEAGFLFLLFSAQSFFHHCFPDMTGVSVPHISPTQIGDYSVAMPPLDEQLEIVACYSRQNSSSQRLFAEAEAAVALLQERRAALISAAVTGKIDVRGLVAAPATKEAA